MVSLSLLSGLNYTIILINLYNPTISTQEGLLDNKLKTKNDHFNLFKKIWWFFYRKVCSDESFSEYLLFRKFGRKVNIDNPKTFNEKIQWINIYNRKPIYKYVCDKYLVKEYVEKLIGEKYVPKMIKVYSNLNDIDFNSLPNKFVLKRTHGSSFNIVVLDKKEIDFKECKVEMNNWCKNDYFKKGREWCYKGLERRIICE